MFKLTTVLSVAAALVLTAAAGAQEVKKRPAFEPDKVFKSLDANGDGKLTKDEFKKVAESAPGRLKEQPELLDKAFQRLDANVDGTLSADEFQKFGSLAKRITGGEAAKPAVGAAGLKDADGLFKKLDADKDGKVSKDEFKKFAEHAGLKQLQDRPEFAEKFFGRLDADGNGTLSAEEFKKVAELGQKLVERIKKGDK